MAHGLLEIPPVPGGYRSGHMVVGRHTIEGPFFLQCQKQQAQGGDDDAHYGKRRTPFFPSKQYQTFQVSKPQIEIGVRCRAKSWRYSSRSVVTMNVINISGYSFAL